jgi:aspartate carbamoyltransferase catalytic subunit
MLKKSLLSVNDLSEGELKTLLLTAAFSKLPHSPYNNKLPAAALVFLENSSRTKMSFERACQLAGRPYSIFDSASSSLAKGESFRETFEVLHDYGYRYFVVRLKDEGLLPSLTDLPDSYVVSAGEGTLQHPTQVLGDAAAILHKVGKKDLKALKGFKLAIVGDLKHSRVAHSWSQLAPRLGIHLALVSPEAWRPTWGRNLAFAESLQKVLPTADAVMALRVQKERHADSANDGDWASYQKSFQLKAGMMSGKQFYMHPGPTNWGVELSESLQAPSAANLIALQRQKCFAVRCLLMSA